MTYTPDLAEEGYSLPALGAWTQSYKTSYIKAKMCPTLKGTISVALPCTLQKCAGNSLSAHAQDPLDSSQGAVGQTGEGNGG